MRQNEIEYIYLDGMWLQEKQLLKLAMNVGSFQLAEHYLCALLFDAVLKGRRETVLEVNKVREHYGVGAIPINEECMEEDDDLLAKQRNTADDQAKQLFMKMTKEQRIHVLRLSMSLLLSDYHLFIYARHWLSIYMVVKDRLIGESLNQINFITLANTISPKDLPDRMRMRETVSKNFGREIDERDRGEVYYKMKRNPQKLLCDTFWDILKEAIFKVK